MATLVVQQPPVRAHSRTPPPRAANLTLDTAKLKSAAVPNKHLPYCSPGPVPSPRPFATPLTPHPKRDTKSTSLLHPTHGFERVVDDPPVFAIDVATLARAQDQVATNALPEPRRVFPWLHGLHPDNQSQLAFFLARRRNPHWTPEGIRGLMIVKAGSDLCSARLKGAISPEEILVPNRSCDPSFYDIDPRDGFSVRNFHIQVAKMATLSDIIVYRDDSTKEEDLHAAAHRLAKAQKHYRARCADAGLSVEEYNTFVVSSPFSAIESQCPDLVAVDGEGKDTAKVLDFAHAERQEMYNMAKASEIAHNVWLGPTPDASIAIHAAEGEEEPTFDILLEASDLARPPDSATMTRVANQSAVCTQSIEFPSSGSIMPPTWSHAEVDALMEMCHWIHSLANPPAPEEEGSVDNDGDIQMKTIRPRPRKILIHCSDGYTETTLLAITYFMFVECLPVHEAWIRLHCEKRRNFFAYPSDVSLLTSIQPRIMQESPKSGGGIPSSLPEEPTWMKRLDGSVPSRLLPYMYLGNLAHANNPDLLEAMGITRVLSVGEPISWPQERLDKWGAENLVFIDHVQDNGIDGLTEEFNRCLEFIERGKSDRKATLVHCRVGVSRSATICIAEIMASRGLSFPRAYCFVRARRLNVIIQPHLRFAYELLKWEEAQRVKRGQPLRRELEWATIAREIAAMNKPYTR